MATLYAPSILASKPLLSSRPQLTLGLRVGSPTLRLPSRAHSRSILTVRAGATDSEYSSKRSSSNEPRETIMLPGCDYNHWLIVMEFPKDPAPTREQMIETYLNTLATVLGSMEEAKKNMYAFSTTTYTGFQCTVSEETSEKFKGDKYVNGEIIPCTYPTYQPNKRKESKYVSKRYERRRDGPPAERRTRQAAGQSESASS
ncbi:hypothetical protein CISIN_1g027488mg [Citrus sinensis]|uniref:MORF/ORRM1/DAG-like MORF domain-containing protein n=1 Tax=Citrus sinensis TaxID=2711 RepID=A0A067GGA2_CITSI|nr:hypothetical protein CISIN_1g027488mg [Citrus sinensis]